MATPRTVRHLIAAVAASMLIAAAVSTAAARNLSVSNQNIRVVWSSLEFEAAGVIIRCPLTLEGSFHTRTIAKVERALIGLITRGGIKQTSCTSGIGAIFNGIERYNGVTPTNSLPWHVTYKGFIGRLPNIEFLLLLVSRFRFGDRDSSSVCTAQYGTAEDNMVFEGAREAGGGITGLRPRTGESAVTLFRRDGGILCPGAGAFSGTGETFLLGTTTRITVTLI